MLIIFSFLFLLVKANTNLTIAFGACFKFYRNQKTDVFKRIGELKPDIFLWLGDAAYIDVMPILAFWFPETDINKITEKFNITKNDEYYSEFIKSFPVRGIYDDHDSNQNNGGKYNLYKEVTKQLYLDFIGEPKDSYLRKQNGIYQHFYLNPKIMVIMTDIRYESDEEIEDNLGEEQWFWLEQRFKENAELYILTSGVQVMPDDRDGPETWFTKSKERLYGLIRKYRTAIIFLSGDVHYSELLRHPCPERLGQEIHEFTSSGMNFANADHILFVESIFKFLFPPTYSERTDDFYEPNFGILRIEIDDNGSPQEIVYQTHASRTSEIVLERRINIQKQLRFDEKKLNGNSNCILDIPKEIRSSTNINTQLKAHKIELTILGGMVLCILILIGYLNYKWIVSVIEICQKVNKWKQKDLKRN